MKAGLSITLEPLLVGCALILIGLGGQTSSLFFLIIIVSVMPIAHVICLIYAVIITKELKKPNSVKYEVASRVSFILSWL